VGRGWDVSLPMTEGIARKLTKTARFSLADWLILLRAWGLLFRVELALRFLPSTKLLTLALDNEGVETPRASPLDVRPERVAFLVDVAARYHPLRPTCLRRALVLHSLLKERGFDVEFRIGTSRLGAQLDAHAWVEHQGRVLGGGTAAGLHAPLQRVAKVKARHDSFEGRKT
jgi:hypothetical protein